MGALTRAKGDQNDDKSAIKKPVSPGGGKKRGMAGAGGTKTVENTFKAIDVTQKNDRKCRSYHGGGAADSQAGKTKEKQK